VGALAASTARSEDIIERAFWHASSSAARWEPGFRRAARRRAYWQGQYVAIDGPRMRSGSPEVSLPAGRAARGPLEARGLEGGRLAFDASGSRRVLMNVVGIWGFTQ